MRCCSWNSTIRHNFIAKCQYSCTRNVLWCQVHSSHIHCNQKTLNLNYNTNKHPGKKSFIDDEKKFIAPISCHVSFVGFSLYSPGFCTCFVLSMHCWHPPLLLLIPSPSPSLFSPLMSMCCVAAYTCRMPAVVPRHSETHHSWGHAWWVGCMCVP